MYQLLAMPMDPVCLRQLLQKQRQLDTGSPIASYVTLPHRQDPLIVRAEADVWLAMLMVSATQVN